MTWNNPPAQVKALTYMCLDGVCTVQDIQECPSRRTFRYLSGCWNKTPRMVAFEELPWEQDRSYEDVSVDEVVSQSDSTERECR